MYANIVNMLIPNINEASINQLLIERKKVAVIIPIIVNKADAIIDTRTYGTTGKLNPTVNKAISRAYRLPTIENSMIFAIQ